MRNVSVRWFVPNRLSISLFAGLSSNMFSPSSLRGRYVPFFFLVVCTLLSMGTCTRVKKDSRDMFSVSRTACPPARIDFARLTFIEGKCRGLLKKAYMTVVINVGYCGTIKADVFVGCAPIENVFHRLGRIAGCFKRRESDCDYVPPSKKFTCGRDITKFCRHV